MKILHVIHSLDPRSGGPSHAIRELVGAQVEAGHDVSVLATTVQSAEPWAPMDQYVQRISEEACFAGSRVTLAAAYGRHRPWSRFAYSPQSGCFLRSQLADAARRPDVVHTHGVFSHVTTLAARIARRHGIPLIIRPTGALDARCFNSGRARLKRWFARLLLNSDLQQAAFLQATSEAEAEELRAWVAPERIRVVPLGVRVVPFDGASAVACLRERFPVVRDHRVVLFLSRVAPIKRPELLVEAVSQLRSSCPDLLLIFAGHDAGGMAAVRNAVRRLAMDDHVLFTGFLEGADKIAAYATAAVFALPSSHENFGVAVVEAMAHGVPVLVTSSVASHGYVDESGCGRTVDGTAEALARGLGEILGEDRHTLGQRGRAYVARHLGWPGVVRRLEALYGEAIGRQVSTRSSLNASPA